MTKLPKDRSIDDVLDLLAEALPIEREKRRLADAAEEEWSKAESVVYKLNNQLDAIREKARRDR